MKTIDWCALLASCVGGTIVDRDKDCGESPETTISGYAIREDWIEIQTDAGWVWGGIPKYLHLTGDDGKRLIVSSQFGMSAYITRLAVAPKVTVQ